MFNMPTFHKKEQDLLELLNIKVEYGEPVAEGSDKGTFKTIGDNEHLLIVEAYQQGLGGMKKLAEKFNRSSATIKNQIDKHNGSVSRSGFCPSCRRLGGKYEKEIVRREGKNDL